MFHQEALCDEETSAVDQKDPNRPRFTLQELRDVLHERNELKAKVFMLQEEIAYYKRCVDFLFLFLSILGSCQYNLILLTVKNRWRIQDRPCRTLHRRFGRTLAPTSSPSRALNDCTYCWNKHTFSSTDESQTSSS